MTTSLRKFRKTTLSVFLFKQCELFKFEFAIRFRYRFQTAAVVLYPADVATAPVARSSKVAARLSKVLLCKPVPVARTVVTKLDLNT